MTAALAQARAAMDAGNIPIGAVIVHNNEIIAVGQNAIDVPGDDTHHAELSAIQAVALFLSKNKGKCTLYTTLEPCMMCFGAIVNVGIESVVIGRPDPDTGGQRLLEHSGYYKYKLGRMQVVSNFMAEQSQQLLDEYVRRTGWRRHLASGAA